MPAEVDSTLLALVGAHARPDGLAWLHDAIAGAAAGSRDVRVVFPALGRQVGRGGLDAPGATLISESGEPVPLAAWRIDDAARVLVLRAAARHDAAGALALARDLYFDGDARERAGALRALSLLPGAHQSDAALPAILDAMRVAQGEIFEAALLDSPYPSRHLPQHEWRKAVLKTVFIGMSIRRIARLSERLDTELAHSLLDYVTEREAAGRSVPAELWPAIAQGNPPGAAAKLLAYLEHLSPEHRAAATVGLGTLLAGGDASLRPALSDRAARETHPLVRDALGAALATGA